MAEADKKKSFWEIFAIVVGAIAALITAVAALLAALNGGAKEKPPKPETVPTAQSAPTKVDKEVAEPTQGDTINDQGILLVYMPEGCVEMGSSSDGKDHEEDEIPVHEICVDGFYMGKYEVTQGQWQKIMGNNPSYFKKGGNYPVEQASWNDAQKFIKKLNSRTGKEYRLPTEAEWEYACRANSPGKYCGGDDLDAVAWHGKNSGDSTHAVGGRAANSFGLYDMSGNVWEWCADRYGKDYYAFSSQSNPVGPESGSDRVARGGGWNLMPWFMRVAYRGRFTPNNRYYNLGFRLVLSGQQGQAGR
jgi:formylglycine-generating enzyme required for sulfatase activity